LHAQVAVIGFYKRTGFRAVGRVFDEAGIAHRKMVFGGELTT
jgi:predicted GNAT family N-acyltransferase